MSQTDPPTTSTTPAPVSPQVPTADVIAMLPMWARAAAVLIPLSAPIIGLAGGYIGGGQRAAIERAVMAERITTLQQQLADINRKLDALD